MNKKKKKYYIILPQSKNKQIMGFIFFMQNPFSSFLCWVKRDIGRFDMILTRLDSLEHTWYTEVCIKLIFDVR